MGLLQKACETYDCHAKIVGVERVNATTLAPISHILSKAEIVITIDQDSNFIAAQKFEGKIVIPVTEESGGRTSSAKKHPHPLCDKLKYIIAEENYYIPQLEAWCNSDYSHPKIVAVLKYVTKKTIVEDLVNCRCVSKSKDGKVANSSLDKIICWNVVGLNENSGPCYTDQSLFDAYIAYYAQNRSRESANLCMISGCWEPIVVNHPRGIVASRYKAKLISSNDSDGFTFRGRFTNKNQAATVSYTASQKAHNALAWLVAEQGVQAGGKTLLCWNPHGTKIVHPTGPFKHGTKCTIDPSNYREELRRTLIGYKSELPEETAEVVITALDPPNEESGRMAITYYNELIASDFLQRLHDWDLHCCWWNGKYGIESPSLIQIVNNAYGTQREEKKENKFFMQTDDKVLRQQMQRLLSCRVDRAKIPLDIVKNLSNRASTPQSYDYSVWQSILFTACAILNQFIYQTKEEEAMEWELDIHDRNFQFGRLLAIMEYSEIQFYKNTRQPVRQTTAMKRMSVFCKRPWETYASIYQHLSNAYWKRMNSWQVKRYKDMCDDVVDIICSFPKEELDKPLTSIYLMGYERQRRELYKSNKKETEDNKNEQPKK